MERKEGDYQRYLKNKILEIIKQKPKISFAEIAEILPISSRTVKKYFEEMKEDGLINEEILQKREKGKYQPEHLKGKKEFIIEEIVDSRRQGKIINKPQLAKKYGVSQGTIYYHMKRINEMQKIMKKYLNEQTGKQEGVTKADEDDELEL